MLRSFTEYLSQVAKIQVKTVTTAGASGPVGSIEDGSLSQSQFSTNYSAWLAEIFSSAQVQDFLKARGVTVSGPVLPSQIELNQNSPTLLPSIVGLSGVQVQSALEALFGPKDSMAVVTGKTTQTRSYVFDFEEAALDQMFSPVNTVPSALTAKEDEPLSIAGLSVSDADSKFLTVTLSVEKGTLTVASEIAGLVVKSEGGSITLEGSPAVVNAALATLTYRPDANYHGDDALKIVTKDGRFDDEDTVIITVTPVNDAPTAPGLPTAAATEGGEVLTVDLLQGASDVDGDTLSVTGLPNPLPAGVSVQNGVLTFDPTHPAYESLAEGASTDVVVAYQVTDGKGGTVAQSLTITVTGTNDAPKAGAALTRAATEDGAKVTVDLLEGASDVDGDTLSIVGLPDGLPAGVTLSGTSLTLDPSAYQSLAAGAQAVAVVAFQVSDGKGGEAQRSVTFTVTGTNDAPVITAAKNLVKNGSFEAPGADAGSWVTTGSLAGWTVAGPVEVVRNPYAVSTPYGNQWLDSQSSPGGVHVSQEVVGVGEGRVYGLSLAVSRGGFDNTTSELVVTWGGVEVGRIKASDLPAGHAFKTFSFAVTGGADAAANTLAIKDAGAATNTGFAIDDVRLVEAQAAMVSENDQGDGFEASGAFLVSDVDVGDALTAGAALAGVTGPASPALADALKTALKIASGPAGNSGQVAWGFEMPNAAAQSLKAGEVVKAVYDVTVSDGKGGTAIQPLVIAITGVNDAPTGAASAALVPGIEDTPYTITAADLLAGFTDVDGDALAVENLTATNGTLAANGNGTWTFTPNADFNGTVSLAYDVVDGQSGSVAATQSFSLAAVNDAPAPTGTPATLAAGAEDTAYTITKAQLLQGWTDVDGDGLSVSGLTATNGSLVENDDGSWTFTPAANYNGPVGLTYSVVDGKGGSTAATQSFSLATVNDAPTGAASAALVPGTEDTPYTISAADLLAGFTDVDGDALSVENLTASNGTITPKVGGGWTFTPAINFNGTVSLSYSVIDGNGGSVAGSQSFTLAAVNDAAVIGNPTNASVTEDAANPTLTAHGTISISDVDGPAEAQFQPGTLSGGNNLGTLTVDASGTYTYAVANSAVQHLGAGQSRVETFTVRAVDGTPKDVSFTIHGANDAAVIGDPNNASVTEDTPNAAAVTLTAAGKISISDLDQGQAGFSTTVTPVGSNLGTLVLQANGDYTYSVANSAVQYLNTGQTKVETFAVQALDGTTKQVSFTINGVDDVKAAPPVYTQGGDSFDITSGGPAGAIYGTASDNGDLKGGNGADTIFGGAGNDRIDGDQGADKLFGGSGNDTLIGDQSPDILVGGYGADLLTGGAGPDTFVFLNWRDTGDTITDFNKSDGDKIAFDKGLGVTFADLIFTQSGANTVVSVDVPGGSASVYEMQFTLLNVQRSNLGQADFIFDYTLVV